MKINEIFQSHQGEGMNIGKFCTFIRFSGCNLNCQFCDTKYATQGVETPIEDILTQLSNHIVFTGGEPFLQEASIYKIILAKNPDYAEVETNGTIPPKSPDSFDLITVSPKTDIDYQFWLDCPNAIFKFAASSVEPIIEIATREGVSLDRVYVMPITTPGVNPIPAHQDMAFQCRQHGINFSPRLQTLLQWGAGL